MVRALADCKRQGYASGMSSAPDIVPDSQYRGVLTVLPPFLRDLALLARLDRPIGWWLLFWPCAWGLFLAGGIGRWDMILWFLAGSIAMRGAGCVYNDIVDVLVAHNKAMPGEYPLTVSRPRDARAPCVARAPPFYLRGALRPLAMVCG